jgi:phenylacetate-CoA ligase
MLMELPISDIPRLAGRTVFFYLLQFRSPAYKAAYQDMQLKRLVRHSAQHVPYYREMFRRIGLDPGIFRGRADLENIPLLDKETVRAKPHEFVADNAAHYHPTWHRTSGSTGTPLRFMLSSESKIVDAAATMRGYSWAGFFPGMKVFSMKSYMRNWVFCKSLAGRALNADTMKLSRETGLQIWQEINQLKPSFFHGYPFALLMLANIARESGIFYHCPRCIISIGESLPVSIRRMLSDAYKGARIYDYYSMAENAALITECRYGNKHVMNDYAFHEFVNPEGRSIMAGQGEIVGTSYYNYAMPLIRYRTRDYARLPANETCCPCGQTYPTVEMIEGRKEDFIVTPEGRLLNLFEEATHEGRGIAASQYIQDAPDRLTVNILPSMDFDPECLPVLEKALRLRIGSTMKIEFKLVEALERRPGDSGKTPFLISRIGHTVYRPEDFRTDR